MAKSILNSYKLISFIHLYIVLLQQVEDMLPNLSLGKNPT